MRQDDHLKFWLIFFILILLISGGLVYWKETRMDSAMLLEALEEVKARPAEALPEVEAMGVDNEGRDSVHFNPNDCPEEGLGTYDCPDTTLLDCPGDEDCNEEEIRCPDQPHYYERWKRAYAESGRVVPEPIPMKATCFTSIKFDLKAGGSIIEGAFPATWDWKMTGVEVTKVDWETAPILDFADGNHELCVCENGVLFIRRK